MLQRVTDSNVLAGRKSDPCDYDYKSYLSKWNLKKKIMMFGILMNIIL